MRITTANTSPLRASADVLVVTLSKPATLEGAAAEIDAALGGTISDLIKAGEIRGARGQVTLVHAGAGVRARRIVVGAGK
jgi:leucyl aminopeptidase